MVWACAGGLHPVGLGIDLISLERAESFLEKHRHRILKRLLSQTEKKKFAKRQLDVRQFSRLFAAKEAYFKACGGVSMGIGGFSAIEIHFLKNNRFRASSSEYQVEGIGQGEGMFFEEGGLVVAEVVMILMSSGAGRDYAVGSAG